MKDPVIKNTVRQVFFCDKVGSAQKVCVSHQFNKGKFDCFVSVFFDFALIVALLFTLQLDFKRLNSLVNINSCIYCE